LTRDLGLLEQSYAAYFERATEIPTYPELRKRDYLAYSLYLGVNRRDLLARD